MFTYYQGMTIRLDSEVKKNTFKITSNYLAAVSDRFFIHYPCQTIITGLEGDIPQMQDGPNHSPNSLLFSLIEVEDVQGMLYCLKISRIIDRIYMTTFSLERNYFLVCSGK